jgi:radical SAM superfamily enzyme YgiQ (UPF0313 family)
MKVLLIDPCREPTLAPRKRGVGRFPQTGLLYVAAATPAEHEVTILEEEVQPVDYDADCDLVGISCLTATARRAYEISAAFRQRGRKVVLGGMHPTVLPGEAQRYADAVVVGEAEPVWAGLLDDAARGTLRPVYRSTPDWDLDAYPLPRRDTSASRAVLGVVPVITSRGCPYACEFCSVRNMFGRAVRHLSIPRVMQDLENANAKRVMFLDDNIVGEPRYAEALFDALRGSGVQWVGQASVSFVRNERLLRKAAASGCKGVFVGLESVAESTMARMQKSMKSQRETADAIRRITGSGILFHASLVFGFDDDGPSTFKETLDFLSRASVSSATFNILTPYPGTALFDKLKGEGRLLTTDWRHYDHCTPTFRPLQMSAEELRAGCTEVRRQFHGLASIARRMPANWRTPILYAVTNFGQLAAVVREAPRPHQAAARELAAVRQVLDVFLLGLLSHGDLLAFGLVQAVTQRFELARTTVYYALHRLVKNGYLTVGVRRTGWGLRRRYYSITKSGLGYLAVLNTFWTRVASGVSAIMRRRDAA